jgi:ferritin-like metal-binding protein YciE
MATNTTNTTNTATSLNDLYAQKLQLLLDAEQQIVSALPQLAEKAKNDELRKALRQHLGETKTHVQRLQNLVERRGQGAQRRPCESMRAMIQEAQTTLPTIQDPDTIDAFIIGAAQGVEHHEMAAYGTARSWASQLGFNEDADTLQTTLDEEGKADQLLTTIAEDAVNVHAAHR